MIAKWMKNQTVRYIFFGGCTTMVNLISYYLLRTVLHVDLTAANMIAIFLAILFAYVVNKLFVFEHHTYSVIELFREAAGFIGMRLGTLCVEVFGMLTACCIWSVPEAPAKIAMQAVVLVLNYVISKLFVFRDASPAETEDASRKKSERLYFAAGFGLSVLIAGIGFAAHGVWPVGDKTVLIVDSLHQYLPFYTDMERKLASSSSLMYSFSGGLGYNFWSTYAYYLASPLNFFLVFVSPEHVFDFMDFAILLKIGLCGGSFSWYLHQRDRNLRFLPAAFGAAFALSNYIVGYYFNLMWLDSIFVLPLIMKGIEEITQGRSGKRYGLALFFGLWCNYYIGFMLCVFSCLYFLVRWISADRIRLSRVGKSALVFAWYSLLAGMLAALVLLPAFRGLSASESMEGNSFPSSVRFYTSFAEMMLNHFILLEPVNISDSQVGLNAYCGVATLLLAVLYLFHPGKKLREKLAHYGLAALLLLSFSLNYLNYIWHGFHIQNGLPNRFAFLYVALLLVMAYDALGALKRYYLAELLVSFAIPAGFVVYAWWSGFGELDLQPYHYWATFGILALWLVLLLFGKYGWGKEKLEARPFFIRHEALARSLGSGIFAFCLLTEVAVNGVNGILENGGVTRSLYLADMISWNNLIRVQEDDTFFRSEVDRQRMRNVTMYVGANGMVMFNSTMLGAVTDFCDALGIEARTNKNGYLGVTKLMNDVFGIKYMASPSSQGDSMYQFRRLQADGELTLYKNDNALPLGFVVRDSIWDWDIHASEEPLDVQNDFVELAVGHAPIYVLDRYIDMEDGENYGIKIPENKQVYLCIDKRVKKIELNTPEYTKTFNDYTDHLYVINSAGGKNMADFTVTLKPNQGTVQAEVYTCPNEEYLEVVRLLDESPMKDIAVDGNVVTGSVDVQNAGVLMLTIPYDRGWDIWLDGKKQDYSPIGDTLIGLNISAGEHEIRMKYTAPGLWLGSALSLAGILLLMLTLFLEGKHPQWNSGWPKEPESEDPDGNPADPLASEMGVWEGISEEAGRAAENASFAEADTDASAKERPLTENGRVPSPMERQLAKEGSMDAWKDTCGMPDGKRKKE